MKLLILQLSDIHFKSSTDLIDRFSKIPPVISAYHYEYDNVLLLLTGDIVYSGKKNEYETADVHLKGLIDEIEKLQGKKPFVCIIPGNHDCDFDVPNNKIREKIIEDITKKNYSAIYEGVIDLCKSVQINYNSFSNSYKNNDDEHIEGLLKLTKIQVLDKDITLLSFNTSWMSRLHEEEGKQFFPIKKINGSEIDFKSDLVISLLHHPYPWFNVFNRQELKTILEKKSDIILTGHEHIDIKELHYDLVGKYTEYIAGDVFNDSDLPNYSGFNIIDIDFNNSQHRITNYKIDNDIYKKGSQTEWYSYKRNLSISKRFFEISDNFMRFLTDVGAKYYHPHKEVLYLNDIYVYPILRDILKSRSPKDVNRFINSESIIKDIIGKQIVFVGAEKSGKTSLCKTIFSESFNIGYLPILIEGHKIINTNIEDFDKILLRNFKAQYSYNNQEYFEQLQSKEKIVIIDDFNKTKLNPNYRIRFINNLREKYPNIIITVDDLFPVEEILYKNSKTESLMKNFKQYQILEFGHHLRHKLIETWMLLGQEQYINDSELTKKIDYSTKIVDTIIGKNFVPSRPLYLLIIMQTIEAGHPHDLQESAYGHYYQYLITQALSKLVKQHDEIDAFYSYLTELSFYLYNNKIKEISKDLLVKFHKWYCYEEYKVSASFNALINLDKLLEILLDSSIIYEYAGSFSFRYKYIYYYFVARFFSNHISKPEIKNEIEKLLSMLYVEEYANIIVFLTHHTKEEFIIDGILSNALVIFSEYEPIKLEDDVATINKLVATIPKIVLEERNVRENRERVMKMKDQIEENEKEENEKEEILPDTPESELDLFTKLNVSFKYIEIIGQLLKNYHGSLNAKSRYKLGREAYNIGMRSLNFFMSGLQENLDPIVKEIINSIEKLEKLDDVEIEALSKKILFSLCYFITTGFVKKVSNSIGHEKLSETFTEILEKNFTNSFNLIDISIKLDFYENFPFAELKNLSEKFKEYGLPHVTLQRLVINYLYMFPTSVKDKQKICTLLGIPIDNQRIIQLKSPEKK